MKRHVGRNIVIVLAMVVFAVGRTDSQERQRSRPAKPAPTLSDVAYGQHERHVLDFWQATSEKPTPVFVWIHGGGFRGGNKSSIPASLLIPFLRAGVSCASIHYRLSHHAPYPAQMHDSARAIQFIRSKADAWNIDPERMAAGGGSAGSGISQWLAFHDDVADEASDDPVLRESSRIAVAGGLATPVGTEMFCLGHIDKSDPPIFQYNQTDPADKQDIHHPLHAIAVDQRCDANGVKSLLLLKYGDSPFEGDRTPMQRDFFFKHLGVR